MFTGKFFLRAAKLLAAAAVGLGLAAGNASADDVFLGTISTSPSVVTVPHLTTGSFTDNLQFTLGALGGIGSSATPINVSFGSFDILNLAFTAGTLFSGSIASPGSAVGSFSNVGGVLSFSGMLTPFATYFAQLTGGTTGAAGGQYAFAIAAVPEAGQWLMLLAGLAMLGVMVRRRAN